MLHVSTPCPFIGNTFPIMGIGKGMNQKMGNKNKKKTKKEQAIGTTENVGKIQNKKEDNENGIGGKKGKETKEEKTKGNVLDNNERKSMQTSDFKSLKGVDLCLQCRGQFFVFSLAILLEEHSLSMGKSMNQRIRMLKKRTN